MPDTTTLDWLDFLTEERKRIFWTAVEALNLHHRNTLATSAHAYDRMGQLEKSFNTRGWGIGHIMDAFSTDEGAKLRNINNIPGIELDNQYFLYFKKFEDIEHLPPEPATIEKAWISGQKQEPIQGWLLEDVAPILPTATPLRDLKPILVGYYVVDGLIMALHFIDYHAPNGYNIFQLDTVSTVPQKQQQAKKVPKSVFSVSERKNKTQ